jgi:quercetin dioxygenase-like cupin family protein
MNRQFGRRPRQRDERYEPRRSAPFFSDTAELGRTTTLFRENGLRTLLLHLKPGEQIPEHQTRGGITVHCLKGEAIFSSGDERVELRPDLLLSLAPGMSHSVDAREDTLLLVAISEQVV